MVNNKKIAKNAIMLYIRMIFMTLISLYTSRVVLSTLGVVDFGIYNVVAGMAVMFTFLNNALYVTTQRFITFEIGRNNQELISEVFSTSINCHMIIALTIITLSESIGLWVLNSQLNIPEERMFASNIIFQISLFSCIIGVLNSPYISVIIAYEKMTFFAWTSLIDASLKLFVVYLIQISSFDKLIFYSILLLCCSVSKFVIDRVYCRIYFKNCNYQFKIIKGRLISMLQFSFWSLLRSAAIIAVNQGNNILINIFGGTIASAAMGIANQVNGAVYSFMQNVQTAFNPQITKTYSVNNMREFHLLLIRSSKFSTYILFLVIVPLLSNTYFVLDSWLDRVPEYSVELCRLALISVLLDAMTGSLNTAAMSEGRIRNYQIITSIIWILAVPLTWLFLHFGISCGYIIIAKIISQMFTLSFNVLYLSKKVNLPANTFILESIIKPFAILLLSLFVVAFSISYVTNDILKLTLSAIINLLVLVFLIMSIGVDNNERRKLILFIKQRIRV